MNAIPQETFTFLATRARKQTVERYNAPAEMFDQALRLVQAGHVHLDGRNWGRVYDEPDDPNEWRRGWMAVTSKFCAHCDDAAYPIVCRHKLAIWFADLLARNTPEDPGRSGSRTAPHSIGLPSQRSGSRPRRSRHKARRGAPGHCPHCGGFLTAQGGCNKCGAS